MEVSANFKLHFYEENYTLGKTLSNFHTYNKVDIHVYQAHYKVTSANSRPIIHSPIIAFIRTLIQQIADYSNDLI